MDAGTQSRAATTLRGLKRQARQLAEREAPHAGSSSRRKAVRSAFVSRQTGRHYARLLADHVTTLERERDEAVQSINQTVGEVKALRHWLSMNTATAQEMYPAPSQSTLFLDEMIEGRSILVHDEALGWANRCNLREYG